MRKGTSQIERTPGPLQPDYFRLDERSMDDLYQEAKKLAEALIFYEGLEENGTGSWKVFFDEAESHLQNIHKAVSEKDFLQQPGSGTCPPHLGLYLAFLKLYGHAQTQLNSLPAAHLHFFYEKILGLEKKQLRPDKVYVFFGLDRKVESYLLARGTALLAGKDAEGKEISYTTDRDLSLNNAKIKRFLAIHHQKTPAGRIYDFSAVNSSDGSGASLEEGQGWFPFGNPKIKQSSAVAGLGIGSPMLFLEEGSRTIYISFSLTNKNIAADIHRLRPDEFEVLLTGPGQYFSKAINDIHYQEGKLTFVIEMTKMDPPVIAFDPEKHGDPIGVPMEWPLLKILLKKGFTSGLYTFMQSLQFTRITIKVDVKKAGSLIARNDFGDLDINRSFQPFGYSPLWGANLYLGLKETFYKPVMSYAINIKWKGLPEDFKAHYEGYLGPTNSLVEKEEDFKVTAAILHQKSWIEIKNQSTKTSEFSLFGSKINLNLTDLPTEKIIRSRKTSEKNGLIRLCLSSPRQAFGHALYPAVYAKTILDQLQEKPSPIPYEPYTPAIENINLSYTAEENIDLMTSPSSSFRFFHAEPFGINEISGNSPRPGSFKGLHFLSDEFHHAGNLYLGVENLNPPRQLTLFFKIKEESLVDTPDLEFYYLSKTGWCPLPEKQVLSDTTIGLRQTGILSLSLPADATANNSKLPIGFHWIRISVMENPDRFDQIMSVKTNAVSCTLHQHYYYAGLNVNELPPGSIHRFSRKIAEIKEIDQPFSSFGGRPEEKKINYFTRVSEMLRHKMRGITPWDMEKLILEQFPEIYKVKCIPHTDDHGKPAPGSVLIIVIPTIKPADTLQALKPMVPKSTLIEIRNYIFPLVSTNAKFKVSNPVYEEIKVSAVINFNIQADAGIYIKQLQNELRQFLSPWAFHKDAEIRLGNRLYRSSIIEFIESRSYVNFIASIKLLKNNKVIEDHEISPDERSIIYSAETHYLKAIASDRVICQTNQGINQMIVDINFEIQ